MKTVDLEDLPLHTNKVTAIQKVKRQKGSQKSRDALESGNVQEVIDSLTGLQKRFCEEYLVDLNGSAAVLRAGYNTKHPNRIAFQLMENPAIRLAIDALRAERARGTDITKDFVLRGITKAIEMAEASGNLNALLRGHELLARHLGMFIERTEISGPDGEAIRMEQKVREDVADFKSRLARLAATGGTGSVSKLPDRDGDATA